MFIGLPKINSATQSAFTPVIAENLSPSKLFFNPLDVFGLSWQGRDSVYLACVLWGHLILHVKSGLRYFFGDVRARGRTELEVQLEQAEQDRVVKGSNSGDDPGGAQMSVGFERKSGQCIPANLFSLVRFLRFGKSAISLPEEDLREDDSCVHQSLSHLATRVRALAEKNEHKLTFCASDRTAPLRLETMTPLPGTERGAEVDETKNTEAMVVTSQQRLCGSQSSTCSLFQ